METRFKQIFDFRNLQAKKMFNSSYLEDLTGLLSGVASCMDEDDSYFFGKEYYLKDFKDEPNSGFMSFIADFKNSFYNGSSEKINIIRGRAGIGKTLFFKKEMYKLIRNEQNCHKKYIYMNIDFKNIDDGEKVMFYEEWIYNKICENATACIWYLGKDKYKQFTEEYSEIIATNKNYIYFLYPLKFFCEIITNFYSSPCVIVFDNIDLASTETQINVFKALARVFDVFCRFMKQSNSQGQYRTYFAMRPETELVYTEANVGAVINFPLPNILKIFLAVMKKI
ncbi:MAG: hypothetical protein NC088_12960 [Bacteroides sp.]|nr:hypothetical protein [Bacteroides sp.]